MLGALHMTDCRPCRWLLSAVGDCCPAGTYYVVFGRWSTTIVFKTMLGEGIDSLPHEVRLCWQQGALADADAGALEPEKTMQEHRSQCCRARSCVGCRLNSWMTSRKVGWHQETIRQCRRHTVKLTGQHPSRSCPHTQSLCAMC